MEKDREKLIELLSDQVIFGLDEKESAELERLKRLFPDWGKDSFESVATAISLSKLPAGESMPEHLREKIAAQAEIFFSQDEEIVEESGATPPMSERTIIETSPAKTFGWNWLGWAVAVVALVALGLNIWFMQAQPTTDLAKNPTPTVTPTPTLNEQLNQLLASGDSIKASFTPKEFESFKGDVVWSNSEQKGFIRVKNLPINDKTKETYQMWIVDAAQGLKTPVSGGTFDVNENGEIIIPIDPDVLVKDPKAVAITVEKPGGVVVSKQEKVAGIAEI